MKTPLNSVKTVRHRCCGLNSRLRLHFQARLHTRETSNSYLKRAMTVKNKNLSLVTARWLASLGMAWLTVMLLAGCANTAIVEHGITICNRGAVNVYDIKVLYGDQEIGGGLNPFRGVRPPSPSCGGWGVRMSVPEEMTVTWYTDRAVPPHRVVISELKSKVSRTRELQNWELRFNGDKVELWREEATGPRNPNTGLQPRQDVKVFP